MQHEIREHIESVPIPMWLKSTLYLSVLLFVIDTKSLLVMPEWNWTDWLLFILKVTGAGFIIYRNAKKSKTK